MSRRRKLLRSCEDAYALDLDPATVGVTRVVLTAAQEARLRAAAEAAPGPALATGSSAPWDALHDWGFVRGGNPRTGNPGRPGDPVAWIRPRGLSWLRTARLRASGVGR